MASAFAIAMAAGLAVALVNAFFVRRAGRPWRDAARTFLGWFLAFVAAGLAGPIVARWLLVNVF